MTKVRLTTQISGSRDGQDWPGPGTVVDLPDAEAQALINGGGAVDPNDKGDMVVVSPAGVHKPGTTGWPETQPFVEAPADAASDPEGARKAAEAAREGNAAVEVPTGAHTAAHPTGAAMTADKADKATDREEKTREALRAGTVPTVGDTKAPAARTSATKSTNAKDGGK